MTSDEISDYAASGGMDRVTMISPVLVACVRYDLPYTTETYTTDLFFSIIRVQESHPGSHFAIPTSDGTIPRDELRLLEGMTGGEAH